MKEIISDIVRYCKPSQIDGDVILCAAFELRKKDPAFNRPDDEKSLSVDDYNHYSNNHYSSIVTALKNRCLPPGRNGKFAKVDFEKVKQAVSAQESINLDINKNHDSHCEIHGMYGLDSKISVLFVENIEESVNVSDHC